MAKAKKFGAISGVFTPSILTILGVIMYLRLPWIVGQAGLWATLGIILVAHIISFTTSLSVSSIATDKKVETGGSYYIISRSLGLPIGGTLGLALFVGLSFSISLYLIGFAEVLLGYFGFEVTLNNIRIAGTIALLGLTILTFISTSLAIKAQYIILATLALSLVSVFLGNHNYNPAQPLLEPMSGSLPWIALFAIFFPAVTGFEAGVSMSGDLKDPRKQIPVGTIAAVLVGLLVYVGLALFFSFSVERDLLVNDSAVLFKIAWIPQLVVAGILGATLSSALGSILGAPRILQATAIDRITPGVLGKGFGVSNEPRNALLFTFVIALSGILIGELNTIARVVTIFFIITYGFLNITYTVESWAGSDFRPSFKIPGFISIIGALACIIVMIQLDIMAMIAASLVLVGIFLFLKRRELTLQTGDTWNSVWASLVKTGLRKLTSSSQKPRNWRPNVILFSGGVKHRPYLIDMGKALVGKLGIFTNFELIESKEEKTLFSKNQQVIAEEKNGKKSVYTRRYVCRDIYEGIESISKVYGFSGFEPNTILMGWAKNTKSPEAFSKLIKTFRRLDYNTIFLNYDKDSGFGKKKLIDIWWNGEGRNITFALALIRFILSSNHWRSAKVRILVINYHTEYTVKYYDLLQQTLDNNRIEAEIKVINNSVEQLPATKIMGSESLNTDLSIIEINDKEDNFIEKTNALLENLKTTMVISSSTAFDELTVIKTITDERIKETSFPERTDFRVVDKIKLAAKEIIANEVYNIAQNLESLTQKYYNESYGMIESRTSLYQKELLPLFEKTTELLILNCKMGDAEEMEREFLRILNDYSFHAQKTMRQLKEELLLFEKQALQNSSGQYLEQIEKHLLELPHHIRIKYNWKEYKQLKPDSFATGLFKSWKLFRARLTGRPAIYKIKVDRVARYYLYHKRLNTTQHLLREFSQHTFSGFIAIRKLLFELQELIEKGKNGSLPKEKLTSIFQMERDRFKAAIELLDEDNQNFFHSLGHKMVDELVADLQNFNNILQRPGSNFLSKRFVKAFRSDEATLESISGFPEVWHKNASLFANKILLDFTLQSLKNRIEAKIYKYNFDFNTLLNSSLYTPINELKDGLLNYEAKGSFDKKPDRSKINNINVDEFYNGLYEEISLLFQDLPATLIVSGENFSHNLETSRFEEATEVVVSLRKTVEFSIASELIDHSKKHAVDTSLALSKSVRSVKDIIRLINFNLVEETDDDQQDANQKKPIAQDFINKLEAEEAMIGRKVFEFKESVLAGLKNAFASLSSGAIIKISGTIEKKIRATENQRLLTRLANWQKDISQKMQDQFVRLIYSKSEGILWMGRKERPFSEHEISNEEVYAFLDDFAPNPEITRQLPFYYAKLFSGQSGIGDDFWVGMEKEIEKAGRIVKRFQNGHSGILLVSGERNSGKTSLSKYVARQYFSHDNIHNIRSPRECMADVEMFEQKLLKSLKTERGDLDSALQEHSKPSVFIVNDLELWWERKTEGTRVIERMISLVKIHNRNVFFIVNINSHALSIVNKLTNLPSWTLGEVVCEGFDARQLKEIIMLRHQAGAMTFISDKKHEDEMSAWDFARHFNRYFDLSRGNIGTCMNLWLASIKKVSEKTLYIKKPPVADSSFLEKLTNEQVLCLLPFVYHLRMSVPRLTQSLQMDEEMIGKEIQTLLQSGILQEKFEGVYSINPSLQLYLVERLKEIKVI
jgi:amino acid transporter